MGIAYILFILEIILIIYYEHCYDLEYRLNLPEYDLIEEGPFDDSKVKFNYGNKDLIMTVAQKDAFDLMDRGTRRKYLAWAIDKKGAKPIKEGSGIVLTDLLGNIK